MNDWSKSVLIWQHMRAHGVALPCAGGLLDQDEALLHDVSTLNYIASQIERQWSSANRTGNGHG